MRALVPRHITIWSRGHLRGGLACIERCKFRVNFLISSPSLFISFRSTGTRKTAKNKEFMRWKAGDLPSSELETKRSEVSF